MKKLRFLSILIICAFTVPVLCGCGSTTPPEVTDMNDTDAPITDAPTAEVTDPATEPATEPVTEAPKGPLTVVCVGDSITEGVGASNKALYAYPAQLQKLLGDNYKVVNCGKSKATALGSYSKYWNTNGIYYNTTAQYKGALASDPDIVLIMLGTNDAKHVTGSVAESVDQFYTALKELGETFAALESKPKIYIMASPYRFEDSVRKANMDSAIYPTQKKLADDMGWEFIDLFNVTKSAMKTKKIHSDNLHFNDDGYAVIAEAIKAELTK
ncbi:MAG: hypothetical protein IJF74_07595 [Clostridia bacterium]|nr:hypothetical protein [Clostridia bacterium]